MPKQNPPNVTRPDRAPRLKGVTFDYKTLLQIQAAADFLGMLPAGFIRFATHRALEQITVIYEELVVASARSHVERESHAFYRTWELKEVPRQDFKSREAFDKMRERLVKVVQEIEQTPIENSVAANAVKFSERVHKNNPRSWGALRFKGSDLDQNRARLILKPESESSDPEERRKYRDFRRVTLDDLFQEKQQHWFDQVKLHAAKWASIHLLRGEIEKIVFRNPETESREEKRAQRDAIVLRAIVQTDSRKKPLSVRLKANIKKLAPLAEKAGRKERQKLIAQALNRTTSRIAQLKKKREQQLCALSRVRQQVQIWDNPRALLEMLESCYSTQGKQSYKGMFPMGS